MATFRALIWQRGYWERIMRNDRELAATRQYIAENPQRRQKVARILMCCWHVCKARRALAK